MMGIITNVLKFITDPKNTRMILFALIVGLVLLLLRQCGKTNEARLETEKAKSETIRVSNNYEASRDSIKRYKLDETTWRTEKLGYELTVEELQISYADLLGKFKVEKNKPPKIVIRTEYVIQEKITKVPVYTDGDTIKFNDTLRHNDNNYRILSGRIPYEIDTLKNKLITNHGNFNIEMGMGLSLGLFKDDETKKISIMVDTDYPGVNFTKLEGASILDNPENKPAIRQLRKNWSLGVNIGYGITTNGSNIFASPYLGLGINYSPKFLQW